MRKLFLYFSLVVLSATMTGCFDNTNPQFSPEINSSYMYVNPVFVGDSLAYALDTLSLYYNSDDDLYQTDTMYIGDTVMFATAFYTVTNNLVAVRLNWDERMKLWFPLTDDVRKVLSSKSDTLKGQLYFNPGYNLVSFPIYFTPTQKGNLDLKLSVDSDSEFSTSSVMFKVPVKEQLTDSVGA